MRILWIEKGTSGYIYQRGNRRLCLNVHDAVLKGTNGLLKDGDTLVNLGLGNVQGRDKADSVVGSSNDQQSTLTGKCNKGSGVDLELHTEDHAFGANLLDERRLDRLELFLEVLSSLVDIVQELGVVDPAEDARCNSAAQWVSSKSGSVVTFMMEEVGSVGIYSQYQSFITMYLSFTKRRKKEQSLPMAIFSATLSVIMIAPMGKPLARGLAIVRMSGVHSREKCWWAQSLPVRPNPHYNVGCWLSSGYKTKSTKVSFPIKKEAKTSHAEPRQKKTKRSEEAPTCILSRSHPFIGH